MAEPVQQQDILPWLKTLPVAPEFHPTLAEFQDPIAYIYKIEKEASQYGICKIVPPVPPPPKKTAITYLNRSLAERAAAGTGGGSSSSGSSFGPTFTTRQQQIGFCPRKARPVQKPVWQSGEYYTFQQFETKAKNFERSYLKKCGNRKAAVSALEIESLYWKATVDKPFSVEYANDMPGSAFAPARNGGEVAVGEGVTVGETAWNMRRVSRAKGSLLRFMKEEIPGVTSPMVYVAMMFSWFAWHAEDHDLHSLNYLHMGASKTWYGVPMEAANAFEEVVRVHGYGEEINPLVTFATLGEKTTMMSPEVFVGLGVPCCRLVQNAGEFVVTFPRAYHMGFSHGFNCGEAANIATPDWLNIAKAAAVRRASINYPPMVSHFQLLYDLAIAMHASILVAVSAKPRSSRLKDKNKDEGETLVKELFVQDVAKNNRLLHILGKGSSIVLLPQSTSGALGANPRIPLGLCSYRGATKSSGSLVSNDILVARNNGFNPVKGYYSVKGKSTTLYERNSSFSGTDNIGTWSSQIRSSDSERRCTVQGDRSSDQRLFSCVTCGILSFACVAVIQPREPTARYLASADCSFFNDRIVGSGVTGGGFSAAGGDAISSEQNSCPRWIRKSGPNSLYDVPVQSAGRIQAVDQTNESVSDRETKRDTSALNLLAMTYGYSSDSEEDRVEPNVPVHNDKENNMTECLLERKYQQDIHDAAVGSHNLSLPSLDCKDEAPSQIRDCYVNPGFRRENLNDGNPQISDCSVEFEIDKLDFSKSKGLDGRSGVPMSASYASNCSPAVHGAENVEFSKDIDPIKNADMSFAPRSHEDSSRMHVFCLEHAVEVEQQLRPIGGVNTLLLCHPDYPKMVAEAKLVAEELGIDSLCDDISFRNATKEDDKRIQLALDSEDAIPGNGDWAVKLGINLFYSANLSGSPLYSKQMPYNAVIYNAFGRNSLASSPTKSDNGRRPTRQRKVVAGKWCGKVWMSNQVHPFLAQKDPEEQEQERSFSAWATPGENLERKPESTRQTLSTLVTRKYSRKRKTLAKCVSIKKPKSIDTEYAGSEYSQEGDPRLQQRRILGSKQARLLEKEDANSSDSPEDIYQQKMSVSRRKQAKYVEKEVGVSNDLLLGNSLKQYRRIPKRKEAKCIGREDAVSDDLPDDSSLKQYRRIPRSKIAKYVEREDGVSDNSLGGTSHRRHTRILKNKKSKCTDREDAISDCSLEDNSLQLQFKRIPESKHAEWIGREEAASDSLEDYSLRLQDKRIPNIKQTKCMESEDAVSDNSLEDDSHQLHRKRIPKSKLAKSMKRDDSISDDSLEDNSRQLYQRIPKSKQAKWIEREDAASDDSLEDYSHQQHRRIPSDKQSKSIEMEDILSYDSAEDNIQQPRRIPRSTAKFTEREDAVLYDLRDDNSHRKHGRTLRRKWLKTETLQKMKQETPSHVEPRKSRLKKQEIPQQVTSQQRRVRSNQNAKQFNSVVEEELEGGPSTRLRKRIPKPHESETKPKEKKQTIKKKVKNASAVKSPAGFSNARIKNGEAYQCDLEGCTMSFGTKQELVVHKKNICPVKGCGKKFFSHKYLVQHRRVHLDDRPLKCPWKGCKMTFKWAWARTEHIRVHTGARPYLCAEPGCGQTFRFVSDFSRHKRKTGHSTKKTRG